MSASGERHYPLLLTRAEGFAEDTEYYQVDTLHSVRLVARERLSTPFEFIVTADTTRVIAEPASLLQTKIGLTVRRRYRTGLAPDRLLHGIVSGIRRVGVVQPGRLDASALRARTRYELTVVPRLWFLSLRSDCRIFQNKTAQEILIILFEEGGVTSYEFEGSGDQTTREYTTQYNETNLDFAHRIMQEAGIFYYFKYTQDDHRLMLGSSNGNFDASLPRPDHKVVPVGNGEDLISVWSEGFRTARDAIYLADYNPLQSRQSIEGDDKSKLQSSEQKLGNAYTWPAYAQSNKLAHSHAEIQTRAEDARAIEYSGKTTDPQLRPGCIFSVGEGVENADARTYVLRSTELIAEDETWVQGERAPLVSNTFSCFLSNVEWREPITLLRPAMAGVFSAVVVGTGDIETDAYGRIKVRPLFDKNRPLPGAPQGAFSSGADIFVRVLSAWTGASGQLSRGWQHLPRVGTEVGLSFMNGDPDEPVVLGCFFNDQAKPPFDLPGDKTKQGYRSHTSPNTAVPEYNELSFDDTAGAEKVLLRAQKDLSVKAIEGSVEITAATSLTLTVGGSSITLLPGSISVKTPGVLNLNAVGDIQMGALGAVEVNAVGDVEIAAAGAVEVNAVGDVEIAGAETELTSFDGGPVLCLPAPA